MSHIYFFVDRLEDGVEEMQKLGLHSEAVVPLDRHAWDCLREWGAVDENVYRQLRERGQTKEEREVWARNMLRSKAGLEELAGLFRDKKKEAKAWKVLDKGYPDLKPELIREMEKRGVELTWVSN
jgi:hypothetical protein